MLRGSDPNNAYTNGAVNTTDLEAVERELPELRAAEGPKVAPAIIDEFGHRIVFPRRHFELGGCLIRLVR